MSGAVKFGLLTLAAGLFAAGAWLVDWQRTNSLEAELEKARNELEALRVDHRDTMDALNKAMKNREKIHEEAAIREKTLEDALRGDPFDKLDVPEHIRLRLNWQNCEMGSAGGASSGYCDTGSGPDKDGWGHGQDNSGRREADAPEKR